jgi:ubiquinone/menaquinone biosynthesis methyltransferase
MGASDHYDPAVTAGKPPLEGAFASADAKRRYNSRMFGIIAPKYDFITRFLSFGRDQAWKRQLIDRAGISAGQRVVDLACGTGDLAVAAAVRGARVAGLDLTPKMIELARERSAATTPTLRVDWLVGDMHALPFATGSVDVVTTGYGLRNVPELKTALVEAHRVLRKGGVLCSLDFDRPDSAWLRSIYLGYLNGVGSTVGWLFHRDADTYRYIPASIRRYPGARAVAVMMKETGFREARAIPVLGGLMAMHIARK